jgi:hypothetical protein
MNDLLVIALGWLLVLVVFLSFLSLRRYLEHRERMAMIIRGITPPDKRRNTLPKPLLMRRAGVLQGGLITAMVGLALTLGLYPIGFMVPPALVAPYHIGPWLLAGLIPLAVGSALIIGHYLTPGRPVEMPPAARTVHLDGQASLSQERVASPHPISGTVEPLALAEPRRWTMYRREAARSPEAVEGSKEETEDGPLPKAEA